MQPIKITERNVIVTWDQGASFQSLGTFDFAHCQTFQEFVEFLSQIAQQSVIVVNDDNALFGHPGTDVVIEVSKPVVGASTVAMDISGDLPRRMQPGWLSEVSDWFREITGISDFQAIQVNQYHLASVIRYESRHGPHFLKASESSIESIVSECLYETLPECVADFVGRHPTNGSFLCKSTGELLADVDDSALYHGAVQALAKVHSAEMELARRLAPLKLSTCVPARARRSFEQLLSDADEMTYWGISAERQQRLVEGKEHILVLFDEVERLAESLTFCHGDAHHRNVVVEKGAVRWFDWGDCLFASPAYDLGWFLAYFENTQVGAVPVERRSDAHLQELVASYSSESETDWTQCSVKALKTFALVSRMAVYRQSFASVKNRSDDFVPGYLRFFAGLLLKVTEK